MKVITLKKYLFVMFILMMASSIGNAQTIDTVAGDGNQAFGGDGQSAIQAQLDLPISVNGDNNGNIFISDYGNNRIRKVNAGGYINTVAGNGSTSPYTDGVLATNTAINSPKQVFVDSSGNIFFADNNYRVLKVDSSSGIITAVAGNGFPGTAGIPGPATAAKLYSISGIVVDSTGNIFISDGSENHILKVDTDGYLTRYAGTTGPGGYSGDNGPAIDAKLYAPEHMALDSDDNLYIADRFNCVIRKINRSTGIITTVAGNAALGPGFSGDGGPATSAQLAHPYGVYVESPGHIYIADSVNHRIRKVDAFTGNISTYAGSGATGIGNGGYGGDNGSPTTATLNQPYGVWGDSSGNIYIADFLNHRVRMITPPPPAPPTDILLSNTSVQENLPAGTVIGTITVVDPNPEDTHTLEILTSGDYHLFQIVGDELQTTQAIDYEALDERLVVIRANDGSHLFSKSFIIDIIDDPSDTNNTPTDITIDNNTINEDEATGTLVGTLDAVDADGSDTHTFTLVAGTGDTGNGSFTISSDQLLTNAVFDYETQTSYSIRVQADDNNGGVFEKQLTIQVSDINEAPILSLVPAGDILRGETQEFAVNISDAAGIIGFRIALDFDPNQAAYVDGSATKVGTLTESGWFDIIVNASNSNQLIFTSAALTEPIPAGSSGDLFKFSLAFASNLGDFEVVNIDFNQSLTDINDGGFATVEENLVDEVEPINDPPSFTKGPDQSVLEDSGTHVITNWATNISKGTSEEASQTLIFNVTPSNPSLFVSTPTIDASGTLTYTPAADQFGSSTIEVVLEDDGGTFNGGDETSDPQTFVINVDPVNDPPSFTKGPDQSVLEDSGTHEITNWATNLSLGNSELTGQALVFNVTPSNPSLFVSTPTIDDSGTLTFTPAANQFGSSTIEVVLQDDGGTLNGGDDTSDPQTFVIDVEPVNDSPSFTKGPDQSVLEDSGTHEITNWATAISIGTPEEVGQTLIFNVTPSNPSLFVSTPTIDASGTLTYTPAANQFGSSNIEVVLEDNGGTFNGGDDTSDPQTFTIDVDPVNDQPSFSLGVASATREVLNDSASPRAIIGYATDIIPGPPNESTQDLEFLTGTDQDQLFSATPVINVTDGTLSYTPAPNQHGIANVTTVLKDDGGTVNGGVDATSPFEFQIYMFIPFQWGELDGNGIVGTVDASLILQFDNFTIFGTDFPAYPPSEFPEYELSDTVFPPAADVSNDGAAGTLDASLILQQYALLLTYFPADGNTDNFGPDPFDLGGKVMAQARANRALSVSILPISGQSNAWELIFSVDDADTLAGMRLALSYDASQLEIVDGETEWMVPGGLVVTNNQQPGHFILSGALSSPLDAGPADLMKVSVRAKDGVNPSQGFTIQVDQELTQLNDGLIELGTNSLKSFNVPEGTAVSTWMVY